MLMPKRYHIYEEDEIVSLAGTTADNRVRIEEFLSHESALLSMHNYAAWADLLTDDITYIVPRRVSRKRGRGEAEFEELMAHFDDNAATMAIRIKRLCESTALWAEDPLSRVRYHHSNMRMRQLESGNDNANEWLVVYNLLIVRNRGDQPDSDLLSAQRQDVLRETSTGFSLAKRLVLLDHAVIGAHNLSFFV
ncbi:MAG: aromatic-ring-hydroxylating dioxygenase subunit beta [Gammaproteobacteria bacterium]|nr:MAG: aromatic-ring-hydroxylating dioxygenase subunit beta [Gammaproteobacteria bacterium]RLA15533.1 MAG: aromatic-ring-hydroxylating dioxygenase subunit beta [Gammaproteobacteria bacterium]